MQNEHLAAWLRYEMDSRRIGPTELSRMLTEQNVRGGAQYISNMRNKGMNYRKAYEIAQALGWSLPKETDLMRAHSEGNLTLTDKLVRKTVELRTIPECQTVMSIVLPDDYLRAQFQEIQDLQSLSLYIKRDSSMAPTILAGDTLLLDTDDREVEMDDVYVFNWAGRTWVRRMVRDPGGTVLMVADAPSVTPRQVTVEELAELEVLGRVVGKWQGFSRLTSS